VPRTRKPKAGRPSLGDDGRSQVLTLKISANERRAFEACANREDLSLSDWIRQRIGVRAIRIVVERDTDGSIGWRATGAADEVVGFGEIDLGPHLDDRVFRAAGEHGVVFDEDAVEFEDLTG
jgi:hypothetical protein